MEIRLIRQIWAELESSNRLLALSGAGYLALFAVLLAASVIDQRAILGINRWIKPMKFAISIAVPQAGFILSRFGDRMGTLNPVWLTVAFGGVYAALASWLFLQAISGRPLFALRH